MSTTAIEPIAKLAKIAIKPGVYRNIPFREYQSWDAVNKSALDDLWDLSPFHFQHFQKNPRPTTPALTAGRAFHTLTLEPEKYEAEFAVAGQCSSILMSGKNAGQRCQNDGIVTDGTNWYCGTHGKKIEGVASDRQVLTEQQDLDVHIWRDRMLSHPICRALIEEPDGMNEVSIAWEDRETGIMCKGRLDMVRQSPWSSIVDLKTTEIPSYDEFSKSVASYGYDRQGAWYLDGAKVLGLDGLDGFVLLGAEKPEPHDIVTYLISSDLIEMGRSCNRWLLRRLARCRETKTWAGCTPGTYEEPVTVIGAPRYYIQQAERKIASAP